MSGRESSDAPGLLRLTLGLLGGPVLALANQQLIYLANTWTCGHNARNTAHVIPALCLIATIGAGVSSYHDWRAVGAGAEDELDTAATRTRFLAIMGMLLSIFSALVILAQWAAIFVFDPCMRA